MFGVFSVIFTLLSMHRILHRGLIDFRCIYKFFSLIPEEFRQFDGEYGILDDEAKAKLTWKYIKTEIKEWIQNWYVKALQKP